METNNYPNWLVPFKVAEELRDIDFREPTFTYYEFDYGSKDGGRYFTPIDINFDSLKIYNRYKIYVSIPTWEQVFDWFRNKGLFGYVDMLILIKDKKVWKYYIKDIKNMISEPFASYEQTREALVEKLIEIYKNENSI